MLDVTDQLRRYGDALERNAVSPPTPPAPARRPRRLQLLVGALATALVIGGAVAFVATHRTPKHAQIRAVTPTTTDSTSPNPTTASAAVVNPPVVKPELASAPILNPPFGSPYAAFNARDGVVWSVNGTCPQAACSLLSAFDARTLRPLSTTPIKLNPIQVATSTDGVWVLSEQLDGKTPSHVTLVDPTTHKVRFDTDVPYFPVGDANPGSHLAASPGYAWVAHFPSDGSEAGEVDRISVKTGTVTPIKIPQSAHALAADSTGVWIAEFAGGDVYRVDATTGAVSTVVLAPSTVGSYINSIAADDDAAWVTIGYADADGAFREHLVRIARVGLTAKVLDTPVEWVAAGSGRVWALGWAGSSRATDETPGFVAQLDPASGKVLHTTLIPFVQYEEGAAAVGGEFWITDGAGTITRVSTP